MSDQTSILILGSCVSRDILAFEDVDAKFRIVDYYARSSLASLSGKRLNGAVETSRIASSFQRRMVERDVAKRLYADLRTLNPDIVLLDLIDERFSVYEEPGGGRLTISTEARQAGFRPRAGGKTLSPYSQQFWRYWVQGWDRLAASLRERGMLNRLVINKVHWAGRTKAGQSIPKHSEELIAKANALLDRMYEHIAVVVPAANFMSLPRQEYVAADEHKWGVTPFHYVPEYYADAFQDLCRRAASVSTEPVQGRGSETQDVTGVAQPVRKVLCQLKYANFKAYDIRLPLNWAADPFKNRNWQHNLTSLRWLKSQRLDVVSAVLKDFHEFHVTRKRANPYYNTLRGDHTIAVRLGALTELHQRLVDAGLTEVAQVAADLLHLDIQIALRPELYRAGHNHGLMLDRAILEAMRHFPDILVEKDRVLERARATLDVMFDPTGATLEHSISYQEYNAKILSDFCKSVSQLQPLDQPDGFQRLLSAVVAKSKKILGFSLRANGQYFPVGDSFRVPSLPALQGIFSTERNSPLEILKPDSTREGMVCESAGFFAYRQHEAEDRPSVHLFLTCGWHSHHHKQNDEGSFCLDVGGIPVFDDPGYTEFIPFDQQKLYQSEAAHTTATIEGVAWSPALACDGRSAIVSHADAPHSVEVVVQHERLPGFVARRTLKYDKAHLLVMEDEFIPKDGAISEVGVSCHNFVLSPDTTAEIDQAAVHLVHSGVRIATIRVEDHDANAQWSVETRPYVPEVRAKPIRTSCVTYRRPLRRLTRFQIDLMTPDIPASMAKPVAEDVGGPSHEPGHEPGVVSTRHRRVLQALQTEAAVKSGAALVERGLWVAPGFAAVSLSPTFDWSVNPFHNRTWVWLLHQWAFVRELIAFDRATGSHQGQALAMAMARSWAVLHSERAQAPRYAWHDHGTALRLQNVLLLLTVTRQHLADGTCDAAAGLADLDFLRDLGASHAQVLAEESFYSKDTNHGLDQSLILYEASQELRSDPGTAALASLALARIGHEVSRAFAADGGHVENSPAYQNFGIKQALDAIRISSDYQGAHGEKSLGLPKGWLEKATTALLFMIRPNGLLPLIGDTSEFQAQDFFTFLKPRNHEEFRYAARGAAVGRRPRATDLVLRDSGWAIFRSDWAGGEAFRQATHIVFKCGFLSLYHRHDDDLSFVMDAFGQEWFTDGGLYKHDHGDIFRKYMRSNESHSLSHPIGAKVSRDLEECRETSRIVDYRVDGSVSTVQASSGMFTGFVSERRLDYDRADQGLTITDRISAVSGDAIAAMAGRIQAGNYTYCTRFLVPSDKEILVQEGAGLVDIKGQGRTLRIRYGGTITHARALSGQKQPRPMGWRSVKAGTLEPAWSIEFYHRASQLDARFEMAWVT